MITVHNIFLILLISLTILLSVLIIKLKGKILDNNELFNRTLSWLLMILTMAGFWSFGETSVIIFFAIISFFVFKEFISITPVSWHDYWPLLFSFYIVLPFQYYLIFIHYYGIFAIFIPVYAFGLLPVITSIVGLTDDFLGRVSKIQWAQFVAIYNISYIPGLYMLNHHGGKIFPLNLIVYLIVLTQFSDIAQYTFGKIFGKHKISPNVSPNKTWEGLIFGGLSAVVVGIILRDLTPFSFLSSILFSTTVVLCGFLGGLSLSGVKRSLNAKDWGHSIPGHGGFMDRMDSLAFSAPVFFHMIRYYYHG